MTPIRLAVAEIVIMIIHSATTNNNKIRNHENPRFLVLDNMATGDSISFPVNAP